MNSSVQRPAAAAAKAIMRGALKAALATRDSSSGFPYASLVTVAFFPDGTPLLLVSRLAVHTRNLEADGRASLLFDASDGAGDPLAGGRVTVVGRMQQLSDPDELVRRRFLARHPGAEMYVDFPDFSFWVLKVEWAHYIGGFGRIVDLGAEDMLTSTSDAAKLIAAEAEIVEHLNVDHSDAVQLIATRLLGAPAGVWRVSGIDPGGLDMIGGDRALRLDFDTRVTAPGMVRETLVSLTKKARQMG